MTTMFATEEWVQRIVCGRAALDLGSPVLEQLVLAELLAEAQPILSQRRAEILERREALTQKLNELLPQWRFRVPEGGLSLWCDLGERISGRLAVSAEQHSVRLAPGSRFAVHGSLERHLRVPYSLPAVQLREAVERLALAAAATSGQPDGNALDPPVT